METSAPTLQAVAAALPIAVILVLMLARRWSAAAAGVAGLVLAWVLALAMFDFGSAPAAPANAATPLRHHAGVLAEGVFLALGILWILLPALALHQHQQDSGALEALRAALARAGTPRPVQVLLVGWCLALFLEGAAGFGTPVALVAPILVGLGVPAVQAVVIALLGHAVGVAFGALGTPVLAQAALTGVAAAEVAWRVALLNVPLAVVPMLFLMRTTAAGGLPSPSPGWAALACAAFVVPALAIAVLLGPELATLGAALASAIVVLGAARLRSGAPRSGATAAPAAPAGPGATAMPLHRALAPYAVLIALVLATRAVPAVADPLAAVVIDWTLPGDYSGSLQPLLHPGTLLMGALVAGAGLQRASPTALAGPFAAALRRLLPVAVALVAMLCLSRLLLHAGMIEALQLAAVAGIGAAWPLFAPALGALGSFVTGSATASNVLFSSLQAHTAEALGLPVAVILAGQTLGAAIGNIVCPHNVVAGAATVGLAGREAGILQRTLVPCLLILVAGGAATLLLARA